MNEQWHFINVPSQWSRAFAELYSTGSDSKSEVRLLSFVRYVKCEFIYHRQPLPVPKSEP
jgi:hypothetical protein